MGVCGLADGALVSERGRGEHSKGDEDDGTYCGEDVEPAGERFTDGAEQIGGGPRGAGYRK
jgi:hypothetical protein